MWELPGMVEIKMQRQDDYPENGVRGGEDVTVLYRGMSAFDYVKGKRLNTATGEAIGAKKAMGKEGDGDEGCAAEGVEEQKTAGGRSAGGDEGREEN